MRKYVLVVVLLLGIIVSSSVLAADFDLTKFGLKPAESYDFGGETVTIISWTSERMSNYFKDNLDVQGRVEEAEKIFNCKIEWKQTREIPEMNFARLLSGESVNDLWHVQNKIGYYQLVSDGALYPVEELFPEEYWDNLPPALRKIEEALKYKGQIWGIGPIEYRPIFGYIPNMTFIAYNKALFEEHSLPDLYELYLHGEWTWEAATDIAVRATMDLNGDGEYDQWGIADARPWYLAASNGAFLTRTDDDGRVTYTGDEPGFVDAIEQIREWHQLGVISPTGGFLDRTAAMHFNVGGGEFVTLRNGMTDDWGIVPYPKGPQVDEYQWLVDGASTTVLPKNAKDPEALLALKTFIWREEDVSVNDVLATHVANPESAEVFLAGQQLWEGICCYLFPDYLGTFQTDLELIYTGEQSAAAAMAELKPVIQANLDQLLGQ